jgi:hypothetical protein
LRPKTLADYRWSLSYHLLPFFAPMRVAEITVADVDRYKAAKLAEGRIAPTQINKTIKRLAQIIDVAIEYGISIERTPPEVAVGASRNRSRGEPGSSPSSCSYCSTPRRTVTEPSSQHSPAPG